MKQRSPKATKGERRVRALLEQTASASGEAFFSALVRCLAQALGTKYACVSVIRGEDELEALALWDGSRVSRGARYSLGDSPCGTALEDGYCIVGENAQSRFPLAGLLRELEIEGYTGIALRARDGRALGV